MNRNRTGQTISGVFVFLLLSMFAVFGTLLVLLGAKAYRSVDARRSAHNEERLLQAFVRHAVRAEDEAGCIDVRERNGVQTLCIRDADEPGAYATYLYVYDGNLYELYEASDGDFAPLRGERICPAAELRACIEGRLLKVEITGTDGRAYSADIVLYAAGSEARE